MHELNTALGSTCEKYELASPDPYIGSRDSMKCIMAYLLNIYVTPHPPHPLLTPMKNTEGDVWEMIWMQKCAAVVVLCDGGRKAGQ